ncbi:MAG: polymerase subunit delta [Thermotogaceae bacterium]|jgi:DNA polymerase-3 subunit delta'|nr:polymerase subunit delta [Thermotogaceae bacterium]
MINSKIIVDSVKEIYKPELKKLFSLANSNLIPAICLSGTDEKLLRFIMELFLIEYEKKTYNEIFNSNDFYEIEVNSEIIKIDDIRKLIKFSTLKKETLKHKYTVIKNIEKANIYAQNSLLKVIEEPGNDTLFLCSTCFYTTLLNTIRSRLFRINIPNKPLKDLEPYFCDEIRWLANISFDVLLEFSQLTKAEQKQLIASLRNKSLNEMTEDFIRSCGEYELEFENGICLKNKALKRLYALIFFERLLKDILFHSSEEVQQLLLSFKSIINKKSLYKGSNENNSTTGFNNAFFKELFSLTEKILYIMLNFQEGALLGSLSYTQLTTLCLKKNLVMEKNKMQRYIAFLEKIKNSTQISLNSELLMLNYLILTQKIFKESE